MAVIALVLMAAAVVLTAGVVMDNTQPATLEAFTVSLDVPGNMIFLTGVLTGLVFIAALGLLKYSLRRGTERRRDLRRLRELEAADGTGSPFDTTTRIGN
ncbi:MAG: hypothetical protein ACRDPT_04130 [Streptomycetales bacterium]